MDVRPASDKASRARATSEETATRSLNAVLCYYHPSANRAVLKTKLHWATEWGTTKQRFHFYESQAFDDNLIATYQAGTLPLPSQIVDGVVRRYDQVDTQERLETMFGYAIADLNELAVMSEPDAACGLASRRGAGCAARGSLRRPLRGQRSSHARAGPSVRCTRRRVPLHGTTRCWVCGPLQPPAAAARGNAAPGARPVETLGGRAEASAPCWSPRTRRP